MTTRNIEGDGPQLVDTAVEWCVQINKQITFLKIELHLGVRKFFPRVFRSHFSTGSGDFVLSSGPFQEPDKINKEAVSREPVGAPADTNMTFPFDPD